MIKKIMLWMFVILLFSFSVNAIELVSSDVNALQYLSLFARNESGNEIATEDCSVNECIYSINPPENETWIISRLIFQIEDNLKMSAAGYGSGAALTNGIEIHLNHSGMIYNITNSQPIKSNAHWGKFCYDVDITNFGTGNEFLDARWTFAKSGTYILLNGSKNDELHIHLNDDFSGLVSQTFLFQGFVIPDKELTKEDDEMSQLALMIGIGLFAGILIYIAFKLTEEHFILKLFMLLFSLISLLFIPTIVLNPVLSTAANFLKLIFGFFIVFLIYFSVYVVWYQIKKSERLLGIIK